MNELICHRCGSHEFIAIEFRNTRFNKILVGKEMVDLICKKCSIVVWNIEGRADASALLKKLPKIMKEYLNRRKLFESKKTDIIQEKIGE